MKSIYVLLAMILFICTSFAQTGIDTIFAQIYPDSVCISNLNIYETCGGKYTASVSISGDSIAIVESDTSSIHYRCMCYFDIGVTIMGLDIGTYRTNIFRTKWYPPYDTNFIGSVNFTILQPSPSLFSTHSYSSDCYDPAVKINEENAVPISFSLIGNYPNPFNPTTIIRYQVNRQSRVKLEIFDQLGRIITALLDEEKPPGDYEVPWDASGLPSGVYLYKLTSEGQIQTRKMTFLK